MNRSILLLSAATLLMLVSCKKSSNGTVNAPVPPVQPPPVVSTPKIKDVAGFNIGCAVSSGTLKADTAFAGTVKREFSQVSPEYEMKMAQIWASASTYNFTGADYIVNFAQQNNIAVHGHTLVWYNSIPAWLSAANYDSVAFESNVKTYISTVVGRYKGKIKSWDVANEIFNDDGTLRVEPQIQGKFHDPIGFVGRCFKYARLADPDVKLFYNDYNVTLASGKRAAIKNMVTRFKKEGYPIDGIGEQFHYSIATSQTQIANGFADLASAGLLIHISEADCRVNINNSLAYIFTDADKQKQSDFFKNIAKLYNALPTAQKFAITTWGVTDKYTWLRTSTNGNVEYPLLFDDNYNKKAAYTGFLAGLK